MGQARWNLPIILLFLLVQQAAVAQEPIHWEATIDSAKAAARQSNRLVLVYFCASYCGPCHQMENDLRSQPGAVSALETNFVPVKIDVQYYPNTAKQYGISRLPTTLILVPNAQGDALAAIPERMPVDQYLSKINQVASDAKHRNAAAFAQIQANPAVGAPAAYGPSPTASPANPFVSASGATGPGSAAMPPRPGGNVAGPAVAMATEPYPPANRGLEPQKPVANARPAVGPLFGLDGFCPVQLAENRRWVPGTKAWGAIHRGRTYLFSGEEQRRRFLADPDRFAPVNSGDDVVLLLEQGRAVAGYREHGVQFDGHVYLFADERTLNKFQSNPHYYADRALQAIRSPAAAAAMR